MANTYELIASVTVGAGGASTISFSSIPSTYTDLVLKISSRHDTTQAGDAFSFNGSTANFTGRRLNGTGSATSSYTATNLANFSDTTGETANTFASSEIYIPNYAGSNNKSYSIDTTMENNATFAYAELAAGLWSITTALSSITLTPASGNFVQYSTAYLYGVKNA